MNHLKSFFLGSVIALLMTASISQAKPGAPSPPRPQSPYQVESARWTLRYMARAGNLILAATDAALDKKPGYCGIKYEESSRLSQNLKILVDEKIRTLTADQRVQIYENSTTCEKDCTCDILALALAVDPSPKAKESLKALNLKAQKVTPKERSLCARKFVAFCQSTLLQTLRKE